MKRVNRQRLLENLMYALIWLVIFIAPVIDVKYNSDIELEWIDIFSAWRILFPFFLLFLVNNFILIPYLLLREKTWYYLATVLIGVVGIFLLLPTPRQHLANRKGIFHMHEQIGKTPLSGPRQGIYEMPPAEQDNRPGFAPREPKHPNPPFWRTPLFFRPYMLFLMTALLIVGINIAIKLLFKSLRDEQRMKELESQSEYVRIFTGDNKPVMTLLSMKVLEEKLPPEKFMRVHRSYIVNLQKISSIAHNRIVFGKEIYIPIGNQYKEKFTAYINKFFLGKA